MESNSRQNKANKYIIGISMKHFWSLILGNAYNVYNSSYKDLQYLL